MLQLSLVPEARFRYEFPYVNDMPSFLVGRENPYLDSELYEYALRTPVTPNHQLPALPSSATTGSQSQSPDPDPHVDQHLAPYWKPYHAAEIIDPYLDGLQPSQWTNVCGDDGLMRKLIEAYLLYEASWFAPFHKDYFLRDMAGQRHHFCSALLVNAVLAIGCVSFPFPNYFELTLTYLARKVYYRDLEYRGEHWNPNFMGYKFTSEARRLFDMESEVEKPYIRPNDPSGPQKIRDWENQQLTTIQACVLMNLLHDCNGSDAVGWRYTEKAIVMAHDIGLFDAAREDLDRHAQCVRDYTAWALYLYQGYVRRSSSFISSYLQQQQQQKKIRICFSCHI